MVQSKGGTTTLAARLHWYYFHDTYHAGQTELLRQIAGKNDQIIRTYPVLHTTKRG